MIQLFKHRKFKDFVLPIIFIVCLIGLGWFTIDKYIAGNGSSKNQATSDNLQDQLIENQDISKEALEALNKKPPEHSANGLKTQTVGKTTIVSEGNLTQEQVDRINQLATTSTSYSNPFDITFTDTTGNFNQLITPLKTYMSSSLLWTNRELPSLYEVRLVNAGASGWAGLYSGGYTISGGQITKVTAYIDLNVYYYQSSPYILEYLQLTLSHEYGHHYTLYNKWLTYNLDYLKRFPDAYYQTRPLSLETTAVDYSKGWSNCDVEIIAEDYKYLFSAYKSHQMASLYGYPTDPGTRNFLLNFGGASTAVDTSPPSVTINSPVSGATVSGTVTISSSASDNIAVSSLKYYLNDQELGTAINYSNDWQYSLNSVSLANGTYSLKARAFDQANNQGESVAISFSVNNQSVDSTPPTVTINSPVNGDEKNATFTFSATVTDNNNINYVYLKIDGTTLAAKNLAPFSIEINPAAYANGSHTLSVEASDGINISTKNITVIFSSSTTPDTQAPTAQITAPSSNPFQWISGNLTITALGSDNINVSKMEFYINNQLVAIEYASSISRSWRQNGTPPGTYTLKAVAYDAAGNSSDTSIQIEKTF